MQPRVLSVQSSVTHGYVGNRAATFPLQLLGFEVDVVNSVQFSNHTGYKTVKGQRLNGEELLTLASGLEENGILADFGGRGDGGYSHLLTGYIGSKTFLEAVLTLLDKMQAASLPDRPVQYVCDPVMGDEGQLYVPEELVQVYARDVLPRADILTPNQFELEMLLGMPVGSIKDLNHAMLAADKLHTAGPKLVVITTLDACASDTTVAMLLSQHDKPVKWLLRLPRVSGGPFTGTGDLTAAMLLAWGQAHVFEPALVLEKAGAVVQEVLQRTIHKDQGNVPRFQENGRRVPPELCLVQSKAAIEAPLVHYRCRAVWSGRGSKPQDTDLPLQGLIVDLSGVARASSSTSSPKPEGGASLQPNDTVGAGVVALLTGLLGRAVKVAVINSDASDAQELSAMLMESMRKHAPSASEAGFGKVDTYGAAELGDFGGRASCMQQCCKHWAVPPQEVALLTASADAVEDGRATEIRTCALLLGGDEDSTLAKGAECAVSEPASLLARLF